MMGRWMRSQKTNNSSSKEGQTVGIVRAIWTWTFSLI